METVRNHIETLKILKHKKQSIETKKFKFP